jgi:Transposase and inactivated derivatives
MNIGCDVHKDFHIFCDMDEKGEIIGEGRIENNTLAIDKFARGHKGSKIAMEASSHSIPVYRQLVKHGFEVHMAHPGDLHKITKSKKKTDEHDAYDLAQLLRTGYLPESWVPDEEIQSLRSLTGRRVELGRRFSKVKNRIHSILAITGVKEPKYSDLFGRMGVHFLEHLNLSEDFDMVLRSLLRELAYLKEEIEILESRLALIATDGRFKKEVEQLMGIRGIGFYSALTILAWIGDVNRFPSHKKLSSWAGLVSSVRITGNTEIHGHITKAGPKELRWILVEDAETAVKYPGKLRRFYLKKKRRLGHKKRLWPLPTNC